MPDASPTRRANQTRIASPAAAVAVGEVRQLASGRAGWYEELSAHEAGIASLFREDGQYQVAKLAGVVVIDGAPLWWDHSANAATPVPPTGDRDFYLGCAVGDAASADTTCVAALNVRPEYEIDFHRDGGSTAIVLSAGTPSLTQRGGTLEAAFSTDAEAQKLDWLSKRSFAPGANWILEAELTVVTNGDAAGVVVSVGVASATDATDLESVAEFARFQLQPGTDLNIDAASDDGTTDVAPADTTVDFAVGTRLHLVIDGRDQASAKFYADGVRVLSGTTFNLSAAAGPLRAIFHMVKTSDDTPCVVHLDALRVRTAEQ